MLHSEIFNILSRCESDTSLDLSDLTARLQLVVTEKPDTAKMLSVFKNLDVATLTKVVTFESANLIESLNTCYGLHIGVHRWYVNNKLSYVTLYDKRY